MLITSLIFYKNLKKDLDDIGFKVNPYDPCISTKMVSNKKMTITWHVDDLKVSRADQDVVYAFIQWAKDTYEDIKELKPSRVKIYYYLDMTLDYTTSGEMNIYTKEYIDKIFEAFPYMEEVKNVKL